MASRQGYRIDVKGLNEAVQSLQGLITGLEPSGELETIIAKATARAHRYSSSIVHVDTARLKNSLYPRVHSSKNNVYGIVGTNVAYALYEHERGGSHAYFQRTIDEEGNAIMSDIDQGIANLVRS